MTLQILFGLDESAKNLPFQIDTKTGSIYVSGKVAYQDNASNLRFKVTASDLSKEYPMKSTAQVEVKVHK